MPYIKERDRGPLDSGEAQATTSGELNYQITQLCLKYVKLHGRSYGTMNEVIGVLECAKSEFYCRKIRPYENEKIEENGDVY